MATHSHDDQAGLDFAIEFSEFSSALRVSQLPASVIDAVKTDMFDTLACACAGITAPGVANLSELLVGWGGKPEAAIWYSKARVPAHHAAWINGMMSHARDFDDIHDTAKAHAGVSVIPAALAAAELNPRATGADVLAGVAVGLELISRLGVSTTASVVESGFLYTSLYGHFAATAAAARVMGFGKEDTINALGIAYSQAAGTHQVTLDGALTKSMQPGFAAKTAMISVALALAGIRGARNTFEGADGLFRSYLRGNYDPARLREGLGERYDLLELSYKLYPCCRLAHSALDAALALRSRVRIENVVRVTAHVNGLTRTVVGTPLDIRRAPQTTVQALFSIPYTVACALIKGTVDLTDFTEPAIRNATVLDMAARIEIEVDDDIDRRFPRTMSPVRLVAETGEGEVEVHVEAPRGSSSLPLTVQDFDQKLQGCLAVSGIEWPADTTAHLREAIWGLENAPTPVSLIDFVGSRA